MQKVRYTRTLYAVDSPALGTVGSYSRAAVRSARLYSVLKHPKHGQKQRLPAYLTAGSKPSCKKAHYQTPKHPFTSRFRAETCASTYCEAGSPKECGACYPPVHCALNGVVVLPWMQEGI